MTALTYIDIREYINNVASLCLADMSCKYNICIVCWLIAMRLKHNGIVIVRVIGSWRDSANCGVYVSYIKRRCVLFTNIQFCTIVLHQICNGSSERNLAFLV